jgi:uncharacterized lipoprotein YajG
MNKILFVLFSLMFLSACSLDQAKTEFLNKVEETKIENQTDDELIKELNTDDPNIDQDLKSLETELSN